MTMSYSAPLVFLSIALSVAMSFVALRMVANGAAVAGGSSPLWSAATALVMGTGIWSMHFVGMLAYQMPATVGFDVLTTVASWAAAVLVCWLGLTFVMTRDPPRSATLIGAVFMGAGIAVMHYSGMSAMQMSPPIAYRPLLAAASVLIGVAASYVALRIVLDLRTQAEHRLWKIVGAASLMGVAVSGLHYTAMAAAIFAPGAISRAAEDFDRQRFAFELSLAIAAVLGIALGAAFRQARVAARSRELEHERRLSVTADLLQTSELRFRAAQEVAIDPFFILSAQRDGGAVTDFIFDYANPAALRFWKLAEADIPGSSFVERFPTALATGLFAVYARVLTTGEPATVEHEYTGEGISGWFRINCVKLLDGVAITFADISERKALERVATMMLEEQTVAREQAEKDSAAKDTFIAAVSHELRNPLNAVLSWVQVLKRAAESSPSFVANALQRIEDNATAQAALVNDLLDVTTVARGKVRLAMQPVDLADVLRQSVQDAEVLARKKDIVVRLEECADCKAVADRQRLRQIMANVLQNAIKFSDSGDAVSVSVRCEDPNAIIEVTDTGIGIDPAVLPSVFDRFAQGHDDHARAREGVGLGLAITRRLVEAHDGCIEAFSEGSGQGTTIRIVLPVSGRSSVALDERTADYF
ncbi:MHYT domain-containing protein [Paraburkholderia sp. EG287A]|uniref:MHYT domain-containing protein n=1 Tax=unclassified Paraburkholderia TaxID=2615204 RepID=UPI0034D1CD1F